MNIPTLYAKKIPASVPTIKGRHLEFKKTYVVNLFDDPFCINAKATFDESASNKPTRRNKYVTLNSAKYRLEWR